MAFHSPQKHFAFGSRTDIGQVREHNEDSLVVKPPLYVVCDGMGGHAAGEVASEIAVNVVARHAPARIDAAELGAAVEEANLAVIRAAHEGRGREGMGTTCTAAMLENERLVIAQVGDSRAYLLHAGNLQQITRDHSLMADYLEAGKITPEEARVHPQRSVITRALGSDPYMQPDLFEINVETGDRLLLCSDGLTSMLEDAEIARILATVRNPQECADALVNEAVAMGGYDNVTVIVTDVSGFAEVRRRRFARKTKITAIVIITMLLLLLGGSAFALTYWTTNSAYLTEQDGHVAIYRGMPGSIAGLSFSELYEVTDMPVSDLPAGVANRIHNGEVRVNSLDEAKQLIETYREEAAERNGDNGDGDDDASSNANASSASSSASEDSGNGDAGYASTSGIVTRSLHGDSAQGSQGNDPAGSGA